MTDQPIFIIGDHGPFHREVVSEWRENDSGRPIEVVRLDAVERLLNATNRDFSVFLAIEANKGFGLERSDLIETFRQAGIKHSSLCCRSAVTPSTFELPQNAYVGPNVVIERDVTIGPHVILHALCRLGQGSRLGSSVSIGRRSDVGTGAHIGDYVSVGENVTIASRLEIGSRVIIDAGRYVGTAVADKTFFLPEYPNPIRVVFTRRDHLV